MSARPSRGDVRILPAPDHQEFAFDLRDAVEAVVVHAFCEAALVDVGGVPAHGSKASKTGTLIKAKFTHQELANMIGSTRETTTLILNDFKRQGSIDFTGRKIVVRSRTELEDILRGPARSGA